MTARDRMVLIVLGALLMLGAAYMLLVSPEQKQASQVAAKVESARSELSAAQTKLAEAQEAE
jgi:type II secretory pathway component PulM